MKAMLIFLGLMAIASAFGVQADYIDVKDTGNENLEPLDVAIFIDCGTKNISALVTGQESEMPIAGADSYLFYTDYGYQPIKRFASDSMGFARTDVPGTLNYLTGLFILRVDKSGYRSREIEFTYQKCQEPPPEPEAPPQEEETPPPSNLPGSDTEGPGTVKPPAQETPPEDVGTPEAENPPQSDESPEPGPAPSACPLGLALLSIVMLKTRY